MSPSEKGRDVHRPEHQSICCQLSRHHLPGRHPEGSIGENMEVAIPGVAEVGEQRAIRCVDGHFLPINLLLHSCFVLLHTGTSADSFRVTNSSTSARNREQGLETRADILTRSAAADRGT